MTINVTNAEGLKGMEQFKRTRPERSGGCTAGVGGSAEGRAGARFFQSGSGESPAGGDELYMGKEDSQ
jgi:hypothetical protein